MDHGARRPDGNQNVLRNPVDSIVIWADFWGYIGEFLGWHDLRRIDDFRGYDDHTFLTTAGEQYLLPEQFFQFGWNGCVHGQSQRHRAESDSRIFVQQ